jgi:hypothetical protein
MPYLFETIIEPPAGARGFGGIYQGGVSLAEDKLAVGSFGTNSNSGSAYVFSNATGEWTLEATFEPDATAPPSAPGDSDPDPEPEGNGQGSFFGNSVSLSESVHGRLAVGAPNDVTTCSGNYCGAVYLYERTSDSLGGGWQFAQKLVDDPPVANSAFGWFVALRGSTLVVGAPYRSGGRVHVFFYPEEVGASVTRTIITASDRPTDARFGWTAAISATNKLIVGASRADGVRGAAYVFQRSGQRWNEISKMSDEDGVVGDRMGTSVTIAEGETGINEPIFVSGSKHKSIGGGHHNGGVFLYAGSPPGESESLIVPPGGDGALNGGAVAAYGTTLVVGPYVEACNPMPGETCTATPDQGKVYVYHECTSIRSCPLDSVITPNGTDDAVGDRFGGSFALGTGKLAIAAPSASSGAGMVYMYTWAPPPPPPASSPIGAIIAGVIAAALVGWIGIRRLWLRSVASASSGKSYEDNATTKTSSV